MRLDILEIYIECVLCTSVCKHIHLWFLAFSTNNYDSVIMFMIIIDECCYPKYSLVLYENK